MTTKTFFLLSLILTLVCASCNKATPAGFWINYKKELLETNISYQGPYGGHRAIYWKSAKSNAFISNSVLDFATQNGWTVVDNSMFSSDQTSKWTDNYKQPVFPLSHTGLSDTAKNISTYQHFPRWFGGQVSVYKFKTGWVTIEPGTNKSVEENGFVVIDSDRTQMAVYHLWGE